MVNPLIRPRRTTPLQAVDPPHALDSFTRFLGENVIKRVLYMLPKESRPIAMLTCSYWNYAVRYGFQAPLPSLDDLLPLPLTILLTLLFYSSSLFSP